MEEKGPLKAISYEEGLTTENIYAGQSETLEPDSCLLPVTQKSENPSILLRDGSPVRALPPEGPDSFCCVKSSL